MPSSLVYALTDTRTRRAILNNPDLAEIRPLAPQCFQPSYSLMLLDLLAVLRLVNRRQSRVGQPNIVDLHPSQGNIPLPFAADYGAIKAVRSPLRVGAQVEFFFFWGGRWANRSHGCLLIWLARNSPTINRERCSDFLHRQQWHISERHHYCTAVPGNSSLAPCRQVLLSPQVDKCQINCRQRHNLAMERTMGGAGAFVARQAGMEQKNTLQTLHICGNDVLDL